MKKQCFVILALLLLFGCSPVLCAANEGDQFFADGLYYYLKDYDGTTGAVICGADVDLELEDASLSGESWPESWPEVIIPSTIAGYPVYGVKGVVDNGLLGPSKVIVSERVRYIYKGAFASTKTGEVLLPSTVEYIGDGFAYYDSPQSISISPGNPYYVVKDGMILTKDLKDLLCYFDYDDEIIVIPSYVETVHSDCISMWDVSGPDAVVFSEGVKRIEPTAIWTGLGLDSMSFPESIEYIADTAFNIESNSILIENVYFMGNKVPNGAEEFLNTIYFNKVYFDYAERDDLCFENTETTTPEDLEAFLALIRDGKLDEAADPENYVRISEPEEQPTQTQLPATPQTEDGETAELQEKHSLAIALSAVIAIGVIATVVIVKKRK